MKASYKANENCLGNRIVNLLKNNGLTQKELADKVGCTGAAMSRYINGKRNPKGQVIMNIANVLHTTSDYLLGMEEKTDFDNEYNQIYRLITRNVKYMTKKHKAEIINVLLNSDDESSYTKRPPP